MTVGDKLVSIVIPVRNGERFLDRTLASALSQTYQPLEVVVVDDGSTDQTPFIVETAASRDRSIRLIRTQKSGVATARNRGISEAYGEFVAPLDADDLWHPEKISRQVQLMQTSPPEVGLVYCWSIDIDENDLVIPPAGHLGSKSRAHGRVTAELATGNFLQNSSSPLIKRSYLDAVGGYDPSLQPHGAEDWKLYLALSEVCEFAVIPEYLVGYRQSTGSLSRDVTGMAESMDLVARWITEKWPDLPHEVSRQRRYNTNVYLAGTALSNNQFLKALQYHARAYTACPARLLGRASFRFSVRLLAKMAGLNLAMLRRYWWGIRTRVPFKEFQAMQRNK